MLVASQLRVGAVVKFEGSAYKVIFTEYRPGQGRMSGAMHTRLRNLDTGTVWEHAFRAELKLEEMQLDKHTLEFLYADESNCFFMDPETFEQTEIQNELVGIQARFLEAGMRLAVEFVAGRPIQVIFPDVLEVKIADTAPSAHQQQDTNFKAAKLENGVEVAVPQFVKTGDVIRLDIANLRYMDRARSRGPK
ncbi:MAG: elongation factor P [Candidatus Solibacter sp.]